MPYKFNPFTGTLDITENLSGYVPYIGATQDLNLGAHNLIVDTNTLYVDSVNHRVGIGTTNPTYNLHLNVPTGAYLALESNTSNMANLLFRKSGNSLWQVYVPGNSTDLRFYYGGDKIILKSDGSVGIGVASPSQKLTVAGNIGIQAGANAFIGTLDNYALSLRTNNTDAVYITNTGNVGIGTTTPVTLLHLYNTSTPPTIRLQDTTTQYGSIYHQSGVLWLRGWNSVGISPASASDKGLIIRAANASQTGNLFEWQNSAGTALGIINKDGWLGIGTAPSSKLHVSSGSSYFDSLPAPSGVSATATSGGTLTAGTYYYIVFALDGNNLSSIASVEVSATVDGSNTNAITISWSAVAGAVKYRVYGRSQGAESQYWETTSTSFTDTGTSGTSGTPPKYGTSALFLKGVGIGMGGGTYKLYVYDSSPQNNYSAYFYISNPNTSGTWYGTGLVHYATPTANSSATYEGARAAATTQSGLSYNINALIGIEAYGLYYGTGVATNVRGGLFTAYNYSTGTTTYAEAIRAQVVNNSTGTITNAYGVRIVPFANNGTITNRWGIYQEGTSENNYFAGNVGLKTSTPSYTLTWYNATYGTGFLDFDSSISGVAVGSSSALSLWAGGSRKVTIDTSGNVGIGTISPNSLLQVAGAISTVITNKTADYTVTISDSIIIGDATTGAFTITLPTAVGIAGRQYTIKKIDGSSNTITIDAYDNETIDGELTQILLNEDDTITIVSDGSNWRII